MRLLAFVFVSVWSVLVSVLHAAPTAHKIAAVPVELKERGFKVNLPHRHSTKEGIKVPGPRHPDSMLAPAVAAAEQEMQKAQQDVSTESDDNYQPRKTKINILKRGYFLTYYYDSDSTCTSVPSYIDYLPLNRCLNYGVTSLLSNANPPHMGAPFHYSLLVMTYDDANCMTGVTDIDTSYLDYSADNVCNPPADDSNLYFKVDAMQDYRLLNMFAYYAVTYTSATACASRDENQMVATRQYPDICRVDTSTENQWYRKFCLNNQFIIRTYSDDSCSTMIEQTDPTEVMFSCNDAVYYGCDGIEWNP